MMLIQGLLKVRAKANIFKLGLGFEPEQTLRDVTQNRPNSMKSVPDLRVTSRVGLAISENAK